LILEFIAYLMMRLSAGQVFTTGHYLSLLDWIAALLAVTLLKFMRICNQQSAQINLGMATVKDAIRTTFLKKKCGTVMRR
jgi:hypothetical protein